MVKSVVWNPDVSAGGYKDISDGETTGLDFPREKAGDARGDSHGLIDAGFEITGFRK